MSEGCQTAIAERILARAGDYLLTLKGNHPLAHTAVVQHFDENCFRRGAPGRASCDACEETHGRLVRRRVFASTRAAALEALSAWPGLRTVLAVETIRSVNGTDKVASEIRYFLSSGADDPATLGAAIRTHWSIENALHWVLDVTFREDDSRVRDRRAARHRALLRKIALNLVGRDRSTRASVRARRKRAAWNDDYMFQLLAGSTRPMAEPE
jgi:predicted transposase YbfD/YdcC